MNREPTCMHCGDRMSDHWEQKCKLCPCGSNAPTPVEAARSEWRQSIRDERDHQCAKGYDSEHDSAHGIEHFLTWAQEYARVDHPLAAAALVEVARERLRLLRAYVDDPGNWSTLDGRRRHLLGLIDGPVFPPPADEPRDSE